MSILLRIVTNSERAAHACPRRWWFRYDQGLISGSSPAPLRMGSLWHHCLAAFYRSLKDRQNAGVLAPPVLNAGDIRTAVIDPWLEARITWAQRNAGNSAETQASAQEIENEDRAAAALTFIMLQGYLQTFGADAIKWRIIGVEVQGARELLNPKTGKPIIDYVTIDGKKRRRLWLYGGGIDLVIADENGAVWFVEHKTTHETDLHGYARKLHWDPQVRGYGFILSNPWPGLSEIAPKNIAGVIYNVARKKAPSAPELLKDGKRLSRARIDTTREVFLAEVLKHGFNPDDYADQLEQLHGKSFFHRESYPLTGRDLEDFHLDASHHALRIKADSTASYHHRQTEECGGAGRSMCVYAGNVCEADGLFARRSYQVQQLRHAELLGEMAEPYVAKLRPPPRDMHAIKNPDFAPPSTTPSELWTAPQSAAVVEEKRGDLQAAVVDVDPFSSLGR